MKACCSHVLRARSDILQPQSKLRMVGVSKPTGSRKFSLAEFVCTQGLVFPNWLCVCVCVCVSTRATHLSRKMQVKSPLAKLADKLFVGPFVLLLIGIYKQNKNLLKGPVIRLKGELSQQAAGQAFGLELGLAYKVSSTRTVGRLRLVSNPEVPVPNTAGFWDQNP